MPSRDPETGKRLPGSKQRQRVAERERPDPPVSQKSPAVAEEPAGEPAERRQRPKAAERLLSVPEQHDAGGTGPVLHSNPFEQLEPPPVHDTAQLISWGARLHAIALGHISRHPEIYPNQREWLRALLGGTTQLGIIRDKAAEQEKIDAALRRDDVKGKKLGLSDVRGRKAQTITRPTG